jgi:hypothetical protein
VLIDSDPIYKLQTDLPEPNWYRWYTLGTGLVQVIGTLSFTLTYRKFEQFFQWYRRHT